MTGAENPFPPELELAIAHTPPEHRSALKAILDLDRNLGRAVAQASEAIVGQLRLAWWRDALSAPIAQRPAGNPLLDDIGSSLSERSAELVKLVDGWETILLAEKLDESSIAPFLEGREGAWHAFACRVGVPRELEPEVRLAARRWAIADLAAWVSDTEDRAKLVELGESTRGPRQRLPRSLRGLAILRTLADRSLSLGGAPLLADRSSALAALRSVVFGR